jgi:hypothetical protein
VKRSACSGYPQFPTVIPKSKLQTTQSQIPNSNAQSPNPQHQAPKPKTQNKNKNKTQNKKKLRPKPKPTNRVHPSCCTTEVTASYENFISLVKIYLCSFFKQSHVRDECDGVGFCHERWASHVTCHMPHSIRHTLCTLALLYWCWVGC